MTTGSLNLGTTFALCVLKFKSYVCYKGSLRPSDSPSKTRGIKHRNIKKNWLIFY